MEKNTSVDVNPPQRKHASYASETARNSLVGLSFFFLSQLVQLFYRRDFIHILGDELMGLNGTLVSIINFLNIAELGLGTAIGFALYRPLVDKDRTAVCEIVSLQGWFYRLVALFVVGVSVVLLFLFPTLLGDLLSSGNIPLWYVYATFVVLLIGALFGYLFNYRQILLFSDLKGYRVTIVLRGTLMLKSIVQIVLFRLFREQVEQAYIAWLIVEVIAAVGQTLWLELIIRKEYPWLRTSKRLGNQLRLKYPEILQKTKQLFFHKITTFVVLMSTPLIIASVLESHNALYQVAVYQNYNLIYTAFWGAMNALFTAFTPTIGKLRAGAAPSESIEKLFRSVLSLRFLLAFFGGFVLLCFSRDIMKFWVGGERYFSAFETSLFALYCFLQLARATDSFTEAYGLFHDVWAPIVETLILLVLSFFLGKLWGLSGIFMGMLASTITIVHIWKPIFLYRSGFNLSPWRYFRYVSLTLLVMGGSGFVLFYILSSLFPDGYRSLPQLLWVMLIALGCYLFINLVISYFYVPHFRQILHKIYRTLLNKCKKA